MNYSFSRKTAGNKKNCILLILFLCLWIFNFKSQRIIDHQCYDNWRKINNEQLSNDGSILTYELNPFTGDGELIIEHLELNKSDTFFLSKNAIISSMSDMVGFKKYPPYDTIRKLKLKKKEKAKLPKDSLFIFFTKTGNLIKIPQIKRYSASKKENYFAYLQQEKKEPRKKKKKECRLFKKKKKNAQKSSSSGHKLTVIDNENNVIWKANNVTSYRFSKKGKFLSYITHLKQKSDSSTLYLINLNDKSIEKKFPTQKKYSLPTWNEKENILAFTHSNDTTKEKNYLLTIYNVISKKSAIIGEYLSVDSVSLFKSYSICPNHPILFSKKNKSLLFFGLKNRMTIKKDTLLESEKPVLDIWHYRDFKIQPQQLVEIKRKKQNYLASINLSNNNVTKLSNDTLSIPINHKNAKEILLGYNYHPYAVKAQWKLPWLKDYYKISALDGTTELLRKEISKADNLFSPNNKHWGYFDHINSEYHLMNIHTKEDICISCDTNQIYWTEDINGQPRDAFPAGKPFYLKNNNKYLFRSRHDLWAYDYSADSLECITKSIGEKEDLIFTPYLWQNDSAYIDYKNIYLLSFSNKTKKESIYYLNDSRLKKMHDSEMGIHSLFRSKNTKTIVLRKNSVFHYPEISILNSSFNNERIASVTNPQQKDYNWASVELVKWNKDSLELEGLLYKPSNFNDTTSYPLLTYYYERLSNRLYHHYTPTPSRSSISPLEYASAGYLVFIPNIEYTAGYPAKSAYNCIMSGVDYILNKITNIDSTKMGLQGQSWGGYQTAQLITMTDRFRAAMAGAPVANMFSAYGGIRWSTGLNRQFQYESTQSRIGKTIWDAPQLYIENSPLFHLPNVNTPLLIMHNDNDGSVPWYQGIELYTGLRRLEKPCWLLNYNNDGHNLRKKANRIDLSIRMRQFFDHFLLEKKAPKWLSDGIPAALKGKELGYD